MRWAMASLLVFVLGAPAAWASSATYDGDAAGSGDLRMFGASADEVSATLEIQARRITYDTYDSLTAEASGASYSTGFNGGFVTPLARDSPLAYEQATVAAQPRIYSGSALIAVNRIIGLAEFRDPSVAFTSSSFDLTADAATCVADMVISQDCRPSVGTGNVSFGSGGVLQVRGDFFVRLLGWSGDIESSNLPRRTLGPGGTDFGVAQWSEAEELLVEDGVLNLSLGTGSSSFLRMSSLDVVAVQDGVWNQGADVAVPAGSTLNVTFADRLEVVGLPKTSKGMGDSLLSTTGVIVPPWLWLLASGAACGVVGLVLVLRYRSSDPILKALLAGNRSKAIALASKAGPPRNAEQSMARAVAHVQAGQFEAAERELKAYALPPADLMFIMACIRVRQGRDDEAKQLLADSIALQPAYAVEVQFNADLARLNVLPFREGYT